MAFACNAGHKEQLQALVDTTHEKLGPVDILLSNAAVNPFYGSMFDIPDDAFDKIMATKTDQKGLIIVHTGKGKGKSTAAFGMIFRCIAHDMKCAVLQFIKGGMSTGERDLILSKFANECAFHTMGEGFTWETQDKTRDTEMAMAAWDKARGLIRDQSNKMVLLDEINIALRYGYVPIADVVNFLTSEKPEMTHVVLTGRNAHADLIEIADLVTEMELVKHPFRSGIKAQIGVEF